MDSGNLGRIEQEIRQHPGITKSELCRKTELAWGTVTHHVHMLLRKGAVVGHRARGRLHLSVPEARTMLPAQAALADPERARILAYLGSHPVPQGPSLLGKELGLDRRVVRRHLHHLETAGLIKGDGYYHPRFFIPELDTELPFGTNGNQKSDGSEVVFAHGFQSR